MSRDQLITVVLAGLCGVIIAAVLLVEDGTAMGSPGLTAVGVRAVVATAAAVCVAAVARLFISR